MKVTMVNETISFRDKINSYFQILKNIKNGSFLNAEKDIENHRSIICEYKKHSVGDINGLRILDLGCGQLASQTFLFEADGAIVTGIDLEIPTFRMSIPVILKVIKTNGFERAVKSLFRHIFFDKKYLEELNKYNTKLPKKVDIRIMSATNLQFPDNTFDFITSDWVFEHIDNPILAIENIYRTLKPDGICRIKFHLFPSLSGSHNLDWRFADDDSIKRTVPPWDHLQDNIYPANVFLNKLKKEDFYNLIAKRFTILEIIEIKEGEKIYQRLEQKIKNILEKSGYSVADLTTQSTTVICKK